MNKTKRPPMVAPIYTFAFTLLLFALVGVPLNDGLEVVIMVFFGLGFSAATAVICIVIRAISAMGQKLSKSSETVKEAQEPMQMPTQEPSSGNPEADAVIKEGRGLLKELETVKDKLKSETMLSKTNEIVDVSHKILDKLRKNPELRSSVKRFSNYYLPTTTKLITNYSYMESQGVKGGNISNTMEKIENTLNTLKNAYKAQLDSLFSQTAIDLETDIRVLENVLKTEGLMQDPFQIQNADNKGD